MGKTVRQIIKIDEELCNGCGLCVTACAEGALQVIDGKARIVSEQYCDGLGACLGECPQGAISFETREAEQFVQEATPESLNEPLSMRHSHGAHPAAHGAECGSAAAGDHVHPRDHSSFVCPSMRVIDRTHDAPRESTASDASCTASELRQWPIKLHLVNPTASYFRDADLLVCADCVPFALGSFHAELLRGKTLVTGCPKFDESDSSLEKLAQIFQHNNTSSVTVAVMEVPCCSGMLRLVEQAAASSGKNFPIRLAVISLEGELLRVTDAPAQ